MTQYGETKNYSVSDHVKAINSHMGYSVIDKIIVNKEQIPDNTLKKYKSTPVYLRDEDREFLKDYEIVELECFNDYKDKVRHDYNRIGKYLIEDYEKRDY